MTFDEVLAQIQNLLQREQRVSYRGLKRRFALDDEYLEDLKEELIGAKRVAIDEEGRFLQLKGLSTPVAVYRIAGESAVQSRFAAAMHRGLTPLVGRAEELALLQQRWAQVKAGAGQAILLSGEPGIGKSRLVQTLKDQVLAEGAGCIEFHCSPYYQNSALYPIIEHLQRLLQFTREDTADAKLEKLQLGLSRCGNSRRLSNSQKRLGTSLP